MCNIGVNLQSCGKSGSNSPSRTHNTPHPNFHVMQWHLERFSAHKYRYPVGWKQALSLHRTSAGFISQECNWILNIDGYDRNNLSATERS